MKFLKKKNGKEMGGKREFVLGEKPNSRKQRGN
jgi:hypothetical protein